MQRNVHKIYVFVDIEAVQIWQWQMIIRNNID